jgi:hypothetical protein
MCLWGIIYIHIEKSKGQDRTLWHPCLQYPWRWHFAVHRNSEFSLWKGANKLGEKEPISLNKLVENANLDNLYSKPECRVISKAFSMSKNTAAVDILLLELRVTWSLSLMLWSVVLWHAGKPNWLVLSRLPRSICFWRIFRFTFSNSLPIVDRRLIGRRFYGNFWSLPGFGNVMIFASFQDFGKWDSRRQWLYFH